MSRFTEEEQIEYDKLTPAEKTKWTIARKKRLRQERIDAGKPGGQVLASPQAGSTIPEEEAQGSCCR